MSVAILLPTLNEEEGIGGMIDKVNAVSKGQWNIYVVDSGSTDKTVEIASAKGARLITLAKRGKGIAVKKAFQEIDDDQLVLIDADLTYSPEDIPPVLALLKSYEVVLGSRFLGTIEPGAISSRNRFGNSALTAMANILYGRRASDVCTGMWGFNKSAYKGMAIDAPHFELEVNIFVQAVKRGYRLCEVPISYANRAGTSKLRLIDGFKIGLYLMTHRF